MALTLPLFHSHSPLQPSLRSPERGIPQRTHSLWCELFHRPCHCSGRHLMCFYPSSTTTTYSQPHNMTTGESNTKTMNLQYHPPPFLVNNEDSATIFDFSRDTLRQRYDLPVSKPHTFESEQLLTDGAQNESPCGTAILLCSIEEGRSRSTYSDGLGESPITFNLICDSMQATTDVPLVNILGWSTMGKPTLPPLLFPLATTRVLIWTPVRECRGCKQDHP